MSRLLVLAAAATLLFGCQWIGRQADALGSYMPVIGERCEHWQCITSSGQTISDAKREEQEKQEQLQKTAPANDATDSPPPQPSR